MQSFLDPIGGTEAIEDRNMQAQLNRPCRLKRECVETGLIAHETPPIAGVKDDVRQMASWSDRNALSGASPLRVEALQLRARIEGDVPGPGQVHRELHLRRVLRH